ncbi:methionyl-tRNA formyltransferase [Campylobacter sp.]|uniref:methionyl-tRNA formyltransferase n=1 Tax=Campylobacter sp. TaxID=205 RepID=UPI0026DACAA9|nr:methionyl-tRNA formyltransferase [Campylobacter sp.]MDO4674795.1 methionyl-tRNA formyltransferase [Campylobacter sp.]
MKKVIFMGTPNYAKTILQALLTHGGFEILALFTQPDKAVGRRQILTPSATKAFLQEFAPHIPIFTPQSLRDEAERIRRLEPDFIVVAAYGKILPPSILHIAPCVNLHASLLPKYRGASPVQSAILNGDEKSGVCTMLMDEGLDTGAILQSKDCDIGGKNAGELFELLARMAGDLILSTLLNFDKIIPQKQDEAGASFCKKIKKEDGRIFLDDAKKIHQKYRAFILWPGVFLENGLKFLELELVDGDEKNAAAGEILALEKGSFLLACKRGILRVKKLQESGKKALDGRTYLNGKRLGVGNFLH